MINFKNKKKTDVCELSDEEFASYIKDAERGKKTLDRAAELEAGEAENARELEKFSKIKQMAMKLYGTDNADDALYKLIKSAAERGATKDDVAAQCAQIAEIFPEFNFEKLTRDDAFMRELARSGNVALAYIVSSTKPKEKTARIKENGTMPYASSGDARRSPADMTDDEFRSYIDRIGNKKSI